MKAFRALALAMVKSFVRDRVSMFFTIAFPIFFIVIFSTIFSGGDGAKQTIAVIGDVPVIQELPSQTRQSLDSYVTFTHPSDKEAALGQVSEGDLGGAVTQQGDHLQIYVSRANRVATGQVQGVMQQIVTSANQQASGTPPRFDLTPHTVESTSMKSIQYVTPGFTAFGICLGATFGAGLTMIEWRARKTLRRLQLAPIPVGGIIGARIVVSLGVALTQLVIFLGVGMIMGLQLSGAWWASIPLVLAGALAFMAIGLIIACIARTAEGGSGLVNMIVLPMSFLSGAFIPLDLAPDWVQTIASFLPLGWIVEGLSDVLVRGQPATAVLWPIALLLAFAGVLTAIGSRFFSWEPA